jgi:hypothetical protein
MIINTRTKQDILNCLQEMSNSMIRIEAERDHMKSILEKMKDEYEIPPKIGRRLAKTFHKRSYEEEVASNQEFSDAYGALAGSEAISD